MESGPMLDPPVTTSSPGFRTSPAVLRSEAPPSRRYAVLMYARTDVPSDNGTSNRMPTREVRNPGLGVRPKSPFSDGS